MRKPYMTDSKPNQQPNEPKEYPGEQDFNKSPGGSNLEGFAEKAKIKPPQQLNHISVPIDSSHIFGKASGDPKRLHSDTKMPSSSKLPSFADQEKVKIPKVKSGHKFPKA